MGILGKAKDLAPLGMLLAILVMVGSGCLFEAREADPPDTGGSSTFTPLDFPEAVLSNIVSGVETPAEFNYFQTLSDDFVFSPLLADSLDPSLSGAFDTWDAELERQVFQLFLAESQGITLELSSTKEIDRNDFVRFRVQYTMTVTPFGGGTAAVYEGITYIDAAEQSGVWRMVAWDEIEAVANATSWGFLRGTLRLRLQG